MPPLLTVEPARRDEWPAALRLAFQHLPSRYQEARQQTALELIAKNEIDPAGVFVARFQQQVVGSLICMKIPGASGLLWPPQTDRNLADRARIEDRLVQHAVAWLQSQGAKLGQTMLVPEEAHLAATLQRNGFPHVTTLCYLRLDLDRAFPAPSAAIVYQRYAVDPERFHQTLLQTYEGTHDCPELTGVRDIGEIIEGHRAQGRFDPHRWLLALHAGQPIGVLLLTDMPEWNSWDVAYVGIVEQARRRGFGRALMYQAIAVSQRGGTPQLTLSVDQRNQPAWNLYEKLGFEVFDRREVYLALWGR